MTTSIQFSRVKVLALAVTDLQRATRFYAELLSLPPGFEGGQQVGCYLGDTLLMFKPDGPARPSEVLNPRITLETEDARATQLALQALGVTIADAVAHYDGFLVGSFLDSEGNKLWFCSPSDSG